MAFPAETKTAIERYVQNHLGDADWHRNFFDFISDPQLATRLGEEFMSARYLYKLLEGMEATDWLLRAQVRLQVLLYASIYEAVLHHLLFERLQHEPKVKELLEVPTTKKISIPAASLAALSAHLAHDGKVVVPMYQTTGKLDSTKIRFDAKAKCACELGLITPDLRDDLIALYEARNAIHIHAEIRKGLHYELDLSKKAYWRMESFRDQLRSELPKLKPPAVPTVPATT